MDQSGFGIYLGYNQGRHDSLTNKEVTPANHDPSLVDLPIFMLSKVTMFYRSCPSPMRATLSYPLTGTALAIESIVHFYSIN
jgi:hypothetical protein